jgi:hypothetical protein
MGIRALFGVTGFVVLCLTGQADAAPPARPSKAEAIVRIHKLHLALGEIVDIVKRAATRKNASDLDVEPLDSSSAGSVNAPCPQGGTVNGSVSVQNSVGQGSGSTASISVTVSNCGTSGGSIDGSVSMTYTTSQSNAATTTTANYQTATLTVGGANVGRYEPRALVVTTVVPKPGGSTSTTTIDGSASIDGYPITFARDPVP